MIHVGDCIAVMGTLPDNSIDAIVTDPPYGLEFMGKAWDKFWTPPGRQKEGGIVGTDGVRRTKTRPVSANMEAPKYVALRRCSTL